MGMEDAYWHECNPFIPVKTIDGKWTLSPGKIWRRKRPDGKWEYRQDEETFDEWIDRQW